VRRELHENCARVPRGLVELEREGISPRAKGAYVRGNPFRASGWARGFGPGGQGSASESARMSFESIRHRLERGRPLVLDADTGASFRARGVALDSVGALGFLLRQRPYEVLDHYRAEVRSRVDVLSALTADTTPRALAEVGMEHRAALLTSLAVDLALEAASESERPVAVAGVLGSEMVGPVAVDRMADEFFEHAARLKVAGAELILARGQGSRHELMAAVLAAVSTALPTWAIVECSPGEASLVEQEMQSLFLELRQAGATAVLLEMPSVESGIRQMSSARQAMDSASRGSSGPALNGALGVLLASSGESVRGFPDPNRDPERWVSRALDLEASGCRVIGGGAGTTEAHTAALARALGALHPSIPVAAPESVSGEAQSREDR
jgi:methionine synthase I (cobalamin-dependent)